MNGGNEMRIFFFLNKINNVLNYFDIYTCTFCCETTHNLADWEGLRVKLKMAQYVRNTYAYVKTGGEN